MHPLYETTDAYAALVAENEDHRLEACFNKALRCLARGSTGVSYVAPLHWMHTRTPSSKSASLLTMDGPDVLEAVYGIPDTHNPRLVFHNPAAQETPIAVPIKSKEEPNLPLKALHPEEVCLVVDDFYALQPSLVSVRFAVLAPKQFGALMTQAQRETLPPWRGHHIRNFALWPCSEPVGLSF